MVLLSKTFTWNKFYLLLSIIPPPNSSASHWHLHLSVPLSVTYTNATIQAMYV